MPCCAMMQPIRNVMSRMIGTARQPTLSSWCTIEVKRNRRGCDTMRASTTTSAPSILTIAPNEWPTDTMFSPTEAIVEASVLP